MQTSRFKDGVKRAYARYDRIMEKQGFYVVLTVCVLVILISAIYTFRLRGDIDDAPDVMTDEAQSAAGMSDNQTLEDARALIESQGAKKAVAVPTETVFRFTQPLDGIIDRGFNAIEPQYFERSQSWQAHMGIDILADYGTIVGACAQGEVKNVWQDNELGLCVLIDHQNGYESLYAGLSNANHVRAGDAVSRGQTIGHVGNGVLAESDAAPHLHLEARKDGQAVDPLNLFLGVDK